MSADESPAKEQQESAKVAIEVTPSGRELGRELMSLVSGLLAEGQRALVVVGAARLDLSLEHLLKSVMLHHPGGSDDLFHSDRPLGTFSAKIALAYRLGLISGEIESSLQLVRKIRNDFAHSIGNASLSESAHSNRLRELFRRIQSDRGYAAFREIMDSHTEDQNTAIFGCALFILLIAIESKALFSKPSPNLPATIP